MIKTRNILLSVTALVALALSANAVFVQAEHACADARCAASWLLSETRAAVGSEAASLVSPKYGTWGFDATGMDLSVKPGGDFFRYANGKWADRTQIPSDRTRYGNFDTLAELSEHLLHAILVDAADVHINDLQTSKI